MCADATVATATGRNEIVWVADGRVHRARAAVAEATGAGSALAEKAQKPRATLLDAGFASLDDVEMRGAGTRAPHRQRAGGAGGSKRSAEKCAIVRVLVVARSGNLDLHQIGRSGAC